MEFGVSATALKEKLTLSQPVVTTSMKGGENSGRKGI